MSDRTHRNFLVYGVQAKRWRRVGWSPDTFYVQLSGRQLGADLLRAYSGRHGEMRQTVAGRLLGLMQRYHAKYGKAPSFVTLKNYIDQRVRDEAPKTRLIEFVESMESASVDDSQSFAYWFGEVVEWAANQQAHAHLAQLGQVVAEDGALSGVRWLADSLSAINAALAPKTSAQGGAASLTALTDSTLLRLDDRDAKGDDGEFYEGGTEWPWASWAAALGRLKPGEMTILSAMQSQGKSFLAKAVACQGLLRNETSVCAELEMSRDQWMLRMLSYFSGVPSTKIERGTYSAEEKELVFAVRDMLRAREKDGGRIIFLPPEECRTAAALRRAIDQHVGSDPLHLVVVDYLAKMLRSGAGGKEDADHVRIGAIHDELKYEVAMPYQVPILTMAHLNRQKQIGFQTLANFADNILQLGQLPGYDYRPPDILRGDYFGRPGILKATVTRARSMASDTTLYLKTMFSTGVFDDVPEAALREAQAEITAK